MPSEIRTITFDNGELIEAIHRARKIVNPPVPAGVIESCRTMAKEGAFVSVTVRNKSDGAAHEIDFGPATVAALLIQYCAFLRIPIPRAAAKSVQASGGNVTLVLKTSPAAEAEPSAG